MPIYAYRCAACGHDFDRLQKMSDPDPEKCPQCGAAAVKRQVTAPSFRLAGSGWYETDFKKDGDKKRNLAGDSKSDGAPSTDKPKAEPAPGATKPDSKSSEAKPAAKGADKPSPKSTSKPD